MKPSELARTREDVADQATGRGVLERLFGTSPRRLLGAPRREEGAPREALSIAIASGKGGTGKSFLTTSLAVVLEESCRVALIDCDFGLACDHLLLGVKPKKTLQHVVSGGASLDDVRLTTPFGPDLIPGGSGTRQMANLSEDQLLTLAREFGALSRDEDVLLMDLGAGISPQSVLTMFAADHVILVTQREIAALTDAYAVIKCLAQLQREPQISVVVNRITEPGQGHPTFRKLAEVASRFVGLRLHYLGEIGEDPAVTQRRLGQPPLVVSDPLCPTSRAIHRILTRLREVIGPIQPRDIGDRGTLEQRFSRGLKRLV